MLCCIEVLEVVVVHLDVNSMSTPFKVMAPLVESFYDGKKFLIVGIIPLFSCLELLRVECYWVLIAQLA